MEKKRARKELEKPTGGHLTLSPLQKPTHLKPLQEGRGEVIVQLGLHKGLLTPGLAQAWPHNLTPTGAGSP